MNSVLFFSVVWLVSAAALWVNAKVVFTRISPDYKTQACLGQNLTEETSSLYKEAAMLASFLVLHFGFFCFFRGPLGILILLEDYYGWQREKKNDSMHLWILYNLNIFKSGEGTNILLWVIWLQNDSIMRKEGLRKNKRG